jgi:hypothetical protein
MQQNEWNTSDPKIYKASRYLLNAGYYIMIAELEQAECWRLSWQDLFWSYDRILYMLYVGPIIFMVILLGWSFIFSGPPVLTASTWRGWWHGNPCTKGVAGLTEVTQH